MSRSDDHHRARGGRAAHSGRPSLEATVSARARDIAGAARFRAETLGGAHAGPRPSSHPPGAPAWLIRALAYLPEPVRLVLREALGGDTNGDPSAEHLRQQRDDLRHREAALDAARSDLTQTQRLVAEHRREVDARARDAERLLAEARRAAEETAAERRVPLARVHVDAADNPRPLRGVVRLAVNIRRYGQLTPVVVRPEGEGYRLVTGFRRMAALALAGSTHVNVRVVPKLDERTAAALYIAENCLVDGLSSKAVSHLAAQFGENAPPAFAEVLAEVQADDEGVVEEVYLEDLAEEARHHLAEGAAWVAALRPHWKDLEPDDRRPLVELLAYFAKVAARVQAGKG